MKTETAVIEMMKGRYVVKDSCLPKQEKDQYYYFEKKEYPYENSFKQIKSNDTFDWSYKGEWRLVKEHNKEHNLLIPHTADLIAENDKNIWNVSEIEDVMKRGISIEPAEGNNNFCCYYDKKTKQFMAAYPRTKKKKIMTLEWQIRTWRKYDSENNKTLSLEEKLLQHVIGSGPDNTKGFEIRKIVVGCFESEKIVYPFKKRSSRIVDMDIEEYYDQKRELKDENNYKLKNVNNLFHLILKNIEERGQHSILCDECSIAKIMLDEMKNRGIITVEKKLHTFINVRDTISTNIVINRDNL